MRNNHIAVNVDLTKDHTQVEIRLPGFGSLFLDEYETDELIECLGHLRRQLPDKINTDMAGTSIILNSTKYEPDFHCRVYSGTAKNQSPTIMLRHSGYGWISYAMTVDQAEDLSLKLLKASAASKGEKVPTQEPAPTKPWIITRILGQPGVMFGSALSVGHAISTFPDTFGDSPLPSLTAWGFVLFTSILHISAHNRLWKRKD